MYNDQNFAGAARGATGYPQDGQGQQQQQQSQQQIGLGRPGSQPSFRGGPPTYAVPTDYPAQAAVNHDQSYPPQPPSSYPSSTPYAPPPPASAAVPSPYATGSSSNIFQQQLAQQAATQQPTQHSYQQQRDQIIARQQQVQANQALQQQRYAQSDNPYAQQQAQLQLQQQQLQAQQQRSNPQQYAAPPLASPQLSQAPPPGPADQQQQHQQQAIWNAQRQRQHQLLQQQQQQLQQQAHQSALFMKSLNEFYTKRRMVFPGPPTIEGKVVDLPRLFQIVTQHGGFQKMHSAGQMPQLVSAIGYQPDPATNTHPESRISAVTQAYHSILFPFEMFIAQSRRAAASPAASANPPSQNVPPNQGGFSQAPPSQTHPSQSSDRPAFQTMPPPPTSIAQGSPAVYPLSLPGGPQGVDPRSQAAMVNDKGKGKAKEAEKKKKPGPVPKSLKRDSLESTPMPSQGLLDLNRPSGSMARPSSIESYPRSQPLAVKQYKSQPPANLPSGDRPPPPQMLQPKVEEPTVPARRKRQKIEYVPLSRNVETFAGWDIAMAEEVARNAASSTRPARNVHDLGVVDIHSLTMSLKSRLGSEVAFALNSLTLISVVVKLYPGDQQGVPFPLANCTDLLDELVDLLEESAFGSQDDWEDDEEELLPPKVAVVGDGPRPFLTYRDMFRLVTEDEAELVVDLPSVLGAASRRGEEGLCPLGAIETVMAITNLLRNFSLSEENALTMSRLPRLVEVLVRVAGLPLKRDGGHWTSRSPLQVSVADAISLRKDALQTIAGFGLEINLEQYSLEITTLIFELVVFFLVDADQQEQLDFDLSSCPSSASGFPRGYLHRIPHYIDLSLAAFARIALPDANRHVLSKLSTSIDLYDLFESLVHLLPITERQFSVVTSEQGLVYHQNLAMALYNLAYLVPAEIKLRLRAQPSLIKVIWRVSRRLSVSVELENPFVALSDRCVATLQILSDVGGVSSQTKEEDGLWFGMGMNGDEEDRPMACNPTVDDRGTVKARKPAAKSGHNVPAVLAADGRSLIELLASGQGGVFRKLLASGVFEAGRAD